MNDKIWYQINSKNLKKFQVIAKNFDISKCQEGLIKMIHDSSNFS